MRIGLVAGEYPPMQGGVGDFTRELACALIDLGHSVQVITGRAARGVEQGDNSDKILVQRVMSSWGVRCWTQIAKVVREHDLDILNVQYEPAAYSMRVGVNFLPSGFVRRMVKRPIVTTFHDLLVPYLFPKAGFLRWKVVEYLARRSDAVIVTNEEDRAKLSNLQHLHRTATLALTRKRQGVQVSPISNLHLIPIGSNIDPARAGAIDRVTERAKRGIQSHEHLIGYFGFLNLSKGGEVLLQALKLLVDEGLPVQLMLIGGRAGSSDPTNVGYAAQVDRLIESLGLQTHVLATGYLDPSDVSRAFLACDVCALPYFEGASLRRGSLMAAIAHGGATIATTPAFPIPGLSQDRSALFVPPNDPLALAATLRQVLTDSGLRARLEDGARQAAKLYTWDQIARQTAEVYEDVLRAA